MEKDLSAYYLLIKKASKEKNSRKKISKDLDKAKSQYGELKADLDALEEEKAKLEEKLNKVKGECSAARKRMLKLHKTVQSMDISNASDAIFYNDDSDDVGFMIRVKNIIFNLILTAKLS